MKNIINENCNLCIATEKVICVPLNHFLFKIFHLLLLLLSASDVPG